MRRLILFCGVPGSGKTTISRKLCKIIEAKLIDFDDFKKTDVDPALVKNEVDPPEVRWKYYQKGLNEAVNLFKSGVQNIIVDEVFHLVDLRNRIEDFCFQQNISIVWIEVQCPYDIVEQRLLSNPRIGHILSSEEALKMYKLFSNIFEPFVSCSHQHILIQNINPDGLNEITNHILQELK